LQVQLLPDALKIWSVNHLPPCARLPLGQACSVAGSTPARRTRLARSSIGSGRRPLKPQGRVRFPHGSFEKKQRRPSGGTGRHATLRTSCQHKTAWEFDSPLGHSMTTQVSQCSAEFHKLSPPGATPGPATLRRKERNMAGYANRKSGEVESLVILWVRFPPRSLAVIKLWAAGPTERRLACNQEIGVRLPGGPLD
jgi:hypothetical protein